MAAAQLERAYASPELMREAVDQELEEAAAEHGEDGGRAAAVGLPPGAGRAPCSRTYVAACMRVFWCLAGP